MGSSPPPPSTGKLIKNHTSYLLKAYLHISDKPQSQFCITPFALPLLLSRGGVGGRRL